MHRFESRIAAIKKAVDDAFDFGQKPSAGTDVEREVDVPEVPPRPPSSLLGPLADLVRGTSSATASGDDGDEGGSVRRRVGGAARNAAGSGRRTSGSSSSGSGRRTTVGSQSRRSTGGSQSKATGGGRRVQEAEEEGPGGVWERLRALLGQPREY